MTRTLGILTAALFTAAIPASVQAVPDNTFGMALMSATVNFDGTLVRGSGVAAVTPINTGVYDVAFDRDLSSCTCTVSGGAHTPGVFASMRIATASCPYDADKKMVRVMIGNHDGTLGNTHFHLIVFCPK